MKKVNTESIYGRVYSALKNGWHMTECDAKYFQVCELRTPIHQAKPFLDAEGYIIRWRWVKSPVTGSRIKEWWAERIPQENI